MSLVSLYTLITNIVFYTDSLTAYMLEGPGAIFTDVRGSISRTYSPSPIDLRWLAPRLVTLVNSTDTFYAVYRSCSLSLFFFSFSFFLSVALSSRIRHRAVSQSAIFDESVVKVSRAESHVSHFARYIIDAVGST